MKPIKVEFQAFGPYRGYESVDFEALTKKGLFLICGKTGIGKTMILDAMTFALFGASSGHGRDNYRAMRCTDAEFNTNTFVRFEFENQGEYYRFERKLERKRVNLADSYGLSKKDAAGIWQPMMENPKATDLNQKAEEIIGLNYEQFRQVIVLPQGQFEKLLTSNSDEKEKILTSIFGEKKWQAIAERFYKKAEDRRNELMGVKAKIQNSLSEENCATIAELELLLKQIIESEKELDEEYKKGDYDKVLKEQQDVLALAKRFGDLHKAKNDLAGLQAKKADRQAWEKTAADARRAEKVRSLISDEATAASSLTRRKNEEESAVRNANTKKTAYDNASAALKKHLEKEKDIDAYKTKKIQYEGKKKDYEGLNQAVTDLASKKRTAETALRAEKTAKEQSDAVAKVIVRVQKEYQDLQKEHEELLGSYLAGITGELASELEEGKPCPVCGSTTHPHKAAVSENGVTKQQVEAKKGASERKYQELQDQIANQEKAQKLVEEKHAAFEKANNEVAVASTKLEGMKKNTVPGIASLTDLEEAIEEIQETISDYEEAKEDLTEAEKDAKDAYTEAKTRIGSAEKETGAAKKLHEEAEKALENGLKANGFKTVAEVKALLLPETELTRLVNCISEYDAGVKATEKQLKDLEEELKGKAEPDEQTCRDLMNEASKAKDDYSGAKAVLTKEAARLQKKLEALQKEGNGIEDKIRIAEADSAFAKSLRGDTGIGIQRYVLGIMFSSVVTAANKMLELVHGGRYQLVRSDEKVQGTNKRGLDLKVYDRTSTDTDGRFVGTLSGGEKFLTSLALSIGMSTIAQKSGIKIEALFIDEGFGSLDDDSIGDAMSVLNSIQEANGLVGIISHVQILQDQIPSKLRVEKDNNGSHIVQDIG